MKSTVVLTAFLGLAVVLATVALARTETYNDLAPYDNTIDGGSYWTTTSHPLRTTDCVTQSLEEFDSKTYDAKSVVLESFDSRACGLFLIVR